MTSSPPSPLIIKSAEAMRQWSATRHAEGLTIGFVPTMGALHAGHFSLASQARNHADTVVVSIFVNPLQFGPGEDFDAYPRRVDADIDALSALGVDVVFVPGTADIYPEGSVAPDIRAGAMGQRLEGAIRPGHFDAVLTVVDRLCDLVGCDVAVFGKKDAQQLAVVESFVSTHRPGLAIIRGETIRDDDGLALSSRNRYLSTTERERALVLPRALQRLAESSDPLATLDDARDEIMATPGVVLDYLEALSSASFSPWTDDPTGQLILVGAIRVGTTRLLDNVWRDAPRRGQAQ